MDRLLELFAGILESPDADLVTQVRECERCATAIGVPVEGLRQFESFVESASRESLAELYAQDNALVGLQLYGNGYGRSMFILDLQKRYRRHGFETGDEPADHLAVILRFLSACDDPAERRELITEILVPALTAMMAGSAEGEETSGVSAFAPLLRSLKAALAEEEDAGASV